MDPFLVHVTLYNGVQESRSAELTVSLFEDHPTHMVWIGGWRGRVANVCGGWAVEAVLRQEHPMGPDDGAPSGSWTSRSTSGIRLTDGSSAGSARRAASLDLRMHRWRFWIRLTDGAG